MSYKYYYQELKEFASDDDFLEARVRKGLEGSFAFEQCRAHWFQDLADALGSSEVGPVYQDPEEYARPSRQDSCALAAMKKEQEAGN